MNLCSCLNPNPSYRAPSGEPLSRAYCADCGLWLGDQHQKGGAIKSTDRLRLLVPQRPSPATVAFVRSALDGLKARQVARDLTPASFARISR